jgi:hypothetical protein
MKFNKDVKTKNESSNTDYLKLSDGESIIGVFRGEIHEFFTKWKDGKSEKAIEGEEGARARYKINIFVLSTPPAMKMWEFGIPVYIQLSDIHDEYPLPVTKVKITRRGERLETTYVIMPLLKEADQLSEKQLAYIESLPLHILDKTQSRSPEAGIFSETEASDWTV